MQVLAAADELTDDPSVLKCEAISERSLRQGEIDGTIDAAQEGLRQLNAFIPRNRCETLCALAWELLVQAVHSLVLRKIFARRAPGKSERDLVTARLCHLLCEAQLHAGYTAYGMWAHLRGLNLTERFSTTPEQRQAYAQHAWIMSLCRWSSRGLRYSRDTQTTSIDTPTEGGRFWAEAAILYERHDLAECVRISSLPLDQCEQSVFLGDKDIGSARDDRHDECDASDARRCRYQLAAAYYRLGRLPEAVVAAQRVYHDASAFAGEHACANGLDLWAMASGGEIPRSILDRELQRPCQSLMTRIQLQLADGLQLLHDGQAANAVDALEQACQTAQRLWMAKPYVATCQAWLTTAVRRLAEEESVPGSSERRLLLRQASRIAKRTRRRAKVYRHDLPHGLREYALLSSLQGWQGRAKRLFEQSLSIAKETHACYEYARTLEERGRIGKALGWEEAGDDVADARYLIQELRSATTSPLITADNCIIRPATVLGATQQKF